MIDTELSDLFFNHDHEQYNQLFASSGRPTMEQIEQAIQEDVHLFAGNYPRLMNFYGATVQDLVRDFMHRL